MKNEEIIKMNKGNKFDICLMNPPYDKSLHLQFLEKAIQVCDNVVSIQPIRWLEEVVGKDKKSSYYNKYEESISKHIKDLETITAENAKILFDIVANMDLGIYICNNYGGFDYKKLSENSIINKVLIYIKENLCNIELNKKDGYRVKVPFIGIGKSIGKTSKPQPPRLAGLDRYNIKNIVYKDGQYNGKWWYEYYNRNQHSKLTEEITSSIKFDTEEEGYNFIKSVQKTDFGRYVESFLITDVNISNQKILWMGNAKNPRTGEIGYKTEWLDEDFDKFFELTEDEIKMYHKYISDFEKSVIKWKDEHVKK